MAADGLLIGAVGVDPHPLRQRRGVEIQSIADEVFPRQRLPRRLHGYLFGVYLLNGAVLFGGEPAYGSIEGEWLCQPPYVVVHRLAVAQEMRRCGLATRFKMTFPTAICPVMDSAPLSA